MSDIEEFTAERNCNIQSYADNNNLQEAAKDFTLQSVIARYSYNFDWMGLPIIQYPQDMVALQEIFWKVKPDLVIECGVARGGSLLLSASLLAMIDYCRASEDGTLIDPSNPYGMVLGIDIDIRSHNRSAIEAHPLASRIELIEGSSIDPDVIQKVKSISENFSNVLVLLDSNHTHEHVFSELLAYAPLVAKGSYCVVFDTIVEDLPEDMYSDRPWGVGDNPKSAVTSYLQYLKDNEEVGGDGARLEFISDSFIDNKLLISVAPDGYLLRL